VDIGLTSLYFFLCLVMVWANIELTKVWEDVKLTSLYISLFNQYSLSRHKTNHSFISLVIMYCLRP